MEKSFEITKDLTAENRIKKIADDAEIVKKNIAKKKKAFSV
jgi:hypothetical protein